MKRKRRPWKTVLAGAVAIAAGLCGHWIGLDVQTRASLIFCGLGLIAGRPFLPRFLTALKGARGSRRQ